MSPGYLWGMNTFVKKLTPFELLSIINMAFKIAYNQQNVCEQDLPIHVKPSVSRLNPAEQSQEKDPSVLRQVILHEVRPRQVHVCVPATHSSKSERKKHPTG